MKSAVGVLCAQNVIIESDLCKKVIVFDFVIEFCVLQKIVNGNSLCNPHNWNQFSYLFIFCIFFWGIRFSSLRIGLKGVYVLCAHFGFI